MTIGLDVQTVERQPTERRRAYLVATIAVLVLGVAAVVLIGYRQIRQAAAELRSAETQIDSAKAAVLSNQAMASEDDISDAETSLIRVNDELHDSRLLSLGSGLPVVSQNLSALRRSVSLALDLVDGARQVIQAAQPLVAPSGRFELSLARGGLPLPTLRAISSTLTATAANLPALTPPPSSHWLVGPVARAQKLVYNAATTGGGLLSGSADALRAVLGLMGGKNERILFAVANDGEMRGTGGMILSYAVVDANDGHLSIEGTGPIDDLALHAPAPVATPADYQGIFAPLLPTQQWRNVNLDSDFAVVAPLMAGMYKAATGHPVTAVVQIDSVALADILAGTGPVPVPGVGTVGAANAVSLTLNQQYLEFPNRGTRQDALRLVVDALVTRVLQGQVNLIATATGVEEAVSGRHLMVWSADPAEESVLSQLGAAGSLPGPSVDFAQLSVENFGANKLDYYLQTSLALTGTRPASRTGQVQAKVTLHNTAPANGTNLEVFGPFDSRLVRGQYVGFVSLHVPAGWYLTGSSGPSVGAPFTSVQDRKTVISFYLRVPAGATRTVTLDLETPPPAPGAPLYLVPVPRVIPTVVHVDLHEGASSLETTLALTHQTVLEPSA